MSMGDMYYEIEELGTEYKNVEVFDILNIRVQNPT